ncbi:MAG TPA: ABC transporter permease [Syntrophobacteraceae bacterium]|nr:ABC transporter permease [Syntrophobacteraceae bacterium]
MGRLTLFLRLWLWFSFRHLRAHYRRTLAVVAGIALGAAVFTSVRLAVHASIDSFTRTVDTLTGKADRVVIHPGGRVPESVVSQLAKHPWVESASPVMTTYVRAVERWTGPFLLVGIDPILDRPLRTWETRDRDVASGLRASAWIDLLREPFSVLLGDGLARRLDVREGGRVEIQGPRGNTPFRVVGILESRGLGAAEGGETALVDIATFQEFTGQPGFVDRVDLLFKPGIPSQEVESLRALLPAALVLEMPGESRESGRLLIRSYELNLSVLSFVSLFVGMFLIYSLVALNAASRRHELAVLRCLGASSRLLFVLFLFEGVFFGVVGWLTAVPLSGFLVGRMLHGVSETISLLFVRVRVDQVGLDSREVALSLLVTVLISILAAWQPARQAMKVPPREALLIRDSLAERRGSARKIAFLGTVLILLVWPLSQLPGIAGIPVGGYLGTFLLFAGFSLVSPWVLSLLGDKMPEVLRKVGGEPGFLGARTIRDAGARIAISVGALITATALFVALVIMVHSFRQTVTAWVNQTITGDLFLRPRMAEFNHYRDPLPRAAVKTLKELETPVQVLPYRRIFLHQGNIRYQFEAIDFPVFLRYAKFLLLEGKPEEMIPKLTEGEGVLISEVFANRSRLRLGDTYRVRIRGVEIHRPVVGIFRDYRTQGGVVHYSLSHFQELTGDDSWGGARVHLVDPGPDPQASAARVREEIHRRCVECVPGVEITLGNDLRRGVLRIFDETFAITTVLLFIALFIAALGIATTLMVLVLERAREFHILLAVGAERSQVRRMILWEAVLMVLTGEIIGLGCGFCLSWILVYVINRQSFGWTFVYAVDWSSLLASLPLVLAAALLATLPASRWVFRRSPAQILRQG